MYFHKAIVWRRKSLHFLKIISLKTYRMTKTVVFKVGMTCGGCSGAVSRILSKIAGKLRLFVFGLSLR
jgi:hypothetical protein